MPMEIASRELDSRLLLACLAVARGYEVVLGQKWLIERNIAAMPPGLYLSKTLTGRDGLAMAEAKRLGYRVAAIDEELPGLVMSAKQLRWMSAEAVAATDLIFIAGSNNAQAVAERFPEAANRVVQAANPRWDLLRPELRAFHAAEVAALKARHGRFILINTNLGFTNSQKGNADQIIRDQARLGKLDLNNPEHSSYVASILQMEADNRQAVEKLLQQLPEAFPGHRVILRPHPSESLDLWTNLIGGRQGMEVIREGAAVPWIAASEILIHTNCTTGVEALALDKPAICVMPSESTANNRYLSNRINPLARDVEETIGLMRRIIERPMAAHQAYSTDMQMAFRQAMSHDPARLGAESVLDRLEPLMAAPSTHPRETNRSAWTPGWRYRWRLKDRNVRGILMPGLDTADIVDRLARFASLLGVTPPAVVEEIGSKTLLLGNRPLGWQSSLRRSVRQFT
ncbi:MAG TPA: surface carbohydrate biosynthesis protein [Dongiaceae bacterium]|nr:surface carbohydrate biosynthesis protein [Dongiaceae bacterium]